MGIAVIGGLIFSTFLTLFVVPAMYAYLSRKTATVSNITETNFTPVLAEEAKV
jgi:multidrug efflux pump